MKNSEKSLDSKRNSKLLYAIRSLGAGIREKEFFFNIKIYFHYILGFKIQDSLDVKIKIRFIL